jgi:hypothetical protein
MANGKPFLPGRGRKSIGDAPGSSYGEKWHQLLDYLDRPKTKVKPKKIRVAGGLYTINQHYVKFQKKGGGMTGYYELCLNFDPIEGTFKAGDAACCPICRDFTDQDLPEDLRMYGTFRYYADAFDVDKIEAGVHDGSFGVVWTNKYGKNDWVKISGTLGDGVFVDDLDSGCILFWYFDENAKDNKDKMSFMKGEPLRVLYNEKNGQYGIRNPKNAKDVFVGSPTDFESIIVPKSAQEIERDLHRVGLYQKLEEHLRATRGGYHADEASSAPRGGQQPRGRAAAPATAPSPAPPDEDFGGGSPGSGDGWGSGGFEEEAPPTPPTTPAATAAAPAAGQAKRGPGRPKKSEAAAPAAAPVDDGWGGGPEPVSTITQTPAPPEQDFGSFDEGGGGDDKGVDFGDGW